jgi:activator of Hsp90 ATPase-like protein
MNNQNFSTTLIVDETPGHAFDAINNVRGWWSEAVEGSTERLGDDFIYRHTDIHYSKQRLIEVIPAKKVAWLVTESNLGFIKNKSEWTGTRISFEISKQGQKTEIQFIHEGLVPAIECFDACSNGWNYYLHDSLFKLITTGKGNPDKKEKAIKAKPVT